MQRKNEAQRNRLIDKFRKLDAVEVRSLLHSIVSVMADEIPPFY